jgi:hypothetical protein
MKNSHRFAFFYLDLVSLYILQYNSESEIALYDGSGIPSRVACLHAVPQHEPHFWY